MNKAIERLKRAWDENPLACIAVGALAVTATAKLIEASNERARHRTWDREVDRRIRNDR